MAANSKSKKIAKNRQFKAFVRLFIGHRKMSEFLSACDLGVDGVGITRVWTITYEPGAWVDEERVKMAMDKTIANYNASGGEHIIGNYEILHISLVPVKEDDGENT